jgi:hypothetical protein
MREIDGRRIKQMDLVVENFQLLGRPLTAAGDADEQALVDGAA